MGSYHFSRGIDSSIEEGFVYETQTTYGGFVVNDEKSGTVRG